MMSALRRLRAHRIGRAAQEEREFYSRVWAPAEIQAWQLDRFNERWAETTRLSPYFRRLRADLELPERFRDWDEFRARVPRTDKVVLRTRAATLMLEGGPRHVWRSTGGSTGEPVRVPVWRSEERVASRDIWYAREWFGVTPGDRLFLLWGHSHLLGAGLAGRVNGMRRRAADLAVGYRRWSAYDLGDDAMGRAGDALVAFRPSYILGYAGALDAFARVNRHRARAFRALGLKVVIATAEAFPSPASSVLIRETLACPVVMEYGAVETGPLAHQAADGRYRVFWRHYHIEGCKADDGSSGDELLVTSLYPRCMPLVRYRIGDLAASQDDAAERSQTLTAVVGRYNESITVTTGERIHSEVVSHAVKDISSVHRYQMLQSEDGRLTLKYVADAPLAGHDAAELRRRLRRGHPVLGEIPFERVDALTATVAGKTPFVVREEWAR